MVPPAPTENCVGSKVTEAEDAGAKGKEAATGDRLCHDVGDVELGGYFVESDGAASQSPAEHGVFSCEPTRGADKAGADGAVDHSLGIGEHPRGEGGRDAEVELMLKCPYCDSPFEGERARA